MARPRAFDEAAVLQKALGTFWRRGYGATSVEDLVEDTGLNRASLYGTFGDKHTLFVRALRHYHHQGCQTLTALADDPAQSALDQVRRLLELTAGIVGDAEQKGCFLVNATTELASRDADVQAVVSENQAFLESLLTTILQRGQERGEIRSTTTPLAQARFLVSILSGMRVMAKADPNPELLRDVVRTTLLALA